MFVLLVAIIGVVGSMGGGMTLVGHSRQKSAGVALAQERLERIHRYPYERIAINTTELPLPANTGDVTNPDSEVSADNLSYRGEPLLLTADGTVKHVDDPFTVGRTEFSVYQYVTWVNDPSVTGIHDFKRVVVVVTWKYPVSRGPSHRIEQSTLLSAGTVTVPAASPSPTGSAEATSTPTASPTPSPVDCGGDSSAPTSGALSIVSGSGATTGYTNSTTVSVNVVAVDTCAPITAELSNDDFSTFSTASTLVSGVTSAPTWTILSGDDGERTVYARFRDGIGNVSSTITATIKLDRTAPAAPTGLLQALNGCTTSGNDRTVSLTWTASTPDGSASGNLLGYRLYRNVQTLGYSAVANLSTTTAQDTHKKNTNPVAFKVRAYDKAGNESGDSNVVTYSTSGC